MSTDNELLETLLTEFEESPFDEVEIEVDDLRIHLVREGAEPAGGPAPAAAPVQKAAAPAPEPVAPQGGAPAAAATEATPPEGAVAVKAPLSGTFYHAPSPAEPPFVEVGSRVGVEDPIGLIEVMKLFNTVKAGVAGTVTAIGKGNADVVQEGEALVYIQPDA